jgi:hypothetical protein
VGGGPFAESLGRRLIRLQLRLAGYVERKTRYWDSRSKWIALLVFCLLFGSACLYLLIRAVS